MWWWPGWKEAWEGKAGLAWPAAALWATGVCVALRWTFQSGSPTAAIALWGGVIGCSLANGLRVQWQARRRAKGCGSDESDLFLRARSEYLKGQWFESSQLLEDLLRQQPDHFCGLLLKATMLRKQGKWRDAEAELQRLEVLPEADEWRLEIDRERQFVITGRDSEHAADAA